MALESTSGPKVSNNPFGWDLEDYLKEYAVGRLIDDAPEIWVVDAEFQKSEPVVKGGYELGNAVLVTFTKFLYDTIERANQDGYSAVKRPKDVHVRAAIYNMLHGIGRVVIKQETSPPNLAFLKKFLSRPQAGRHLFGHRSEG